MADAKTERKSLTYAWAGLVLTVSDPERGDEEAFDFAEVPEDLNEDFMELGRRTKLGNFASDSKKKKLPKLTMMRNGFAQLRDGDWAAERVKDPQWLKDAKAEIAAIAAIKGKPESAIRQSLRNLDPEVAKQVLANPDVKAKAKELASTKKEVDLSDLA